MGVYKKQPKKISRLRISDIEKLMFYYRQKYITVFYGFIRCNKVIVNCYAWCTLNHVPEKYPLTINNYFVIQSVSDESLPSYSRDSSLRSE